MTVQVSVRLTQRDVEALDDLVAQWSFASRSAALRAGLARLLAERREAEIEQAYRRGYGEHPQEEWVGELSLAGLAQLAGGEGGDPL